MKIPVDECPAGAAMNAAVAKAMSWKRTHRRPRDWQNWSNYPDEWYIRPDGDIENVTNIPKFSTDITVAMQLFASTPSPLAICRCFLKANGIEFVEVPDGGL